MINGPLDSKAAELVLRVTQDIASNYRNRPPEDDPVDEEIREACAVAAFNTGWFILQAMGFRPDGMREIRRRMTAPGGSRQQGGRRPADALV
jgi:hypothetical protein